MRGEGTAGLRKYPAVIEKSASVWRDLPHSEMSTVAKPRIETIAVGLWATQKWTLPLLLGNVRAGAYTAATAEERFLGGRMFSGIRSQQVPLAQRLPGED